jgi:hypothetical protein
MTLITLSCDKLDPLNLCHSTILATWPYTSKRHNKMPNDNENGSSQYISDSVASEKLQLKVTAVTLDSNSEASTSRKSKIRRPRKRRGKLRQILDMPLDLIYEVLFFLVTGSGIMLTTTIDLRPFTPQRHSDACEDVEAAAQLFHESKCDNVLEFSETQHSWASSLSQRFKRTSVCQPCFRTALSCKSEKQMKTRNKLRRGIIC